MHLDRLVQWIVEDRLVNEFKEALCEMGIDIRVGGAASQRRSPESGYPTQSKSLSFIAHRLGTVNASAVSEATR